MLFLVHLFPSLDWSCFILCVFKIYDIQHCAVNACTSMPKCVRFFTLHDCVYLYKLMPKMLLSHATNNVHGELSPWSSVYPPLCLHVVYMMNKILNTAMECEQDPMVIDLGSLIENTIGIINAVSVCCFNVGPALQTVFKPYTNNLVLKGCIYVNLNLFTCLPVCD